MKKAIGISFAVLGIIFLTSMIMNHSLALSSLPSEKDGTVSKPISSSVMKIAGRSCVKCHTEGGNGMAMMHLDFDKWETYTTDKQADKAKAVCNKVTKGSMPPKSFRSNNPEKVPTQADVQVICNWATSFAKK